jgi:hypothetical protein
MFAPLLLIAGLLTATDDAALRVEVRALVKQLDSAQLAARDAAEARLLELGPPVLDFLPPAEKIASAEVQTRLRRIRQAIEQVTARAAAGGSTVTLHAADMPLAEVLAAFSEQTGNKIVGRDLRGAAAAKITVDFHKTPFWPALDAVADQADLSIDPFAAAGALRLLPRRTGQGPHTGRAATSGPFRVEPTRVVARRDFRSPAAASLLLTLEVAWEPRVRPIGLVQRMADVKAEDNRGRPIAVDDPQTILEAFPPRDASAVEIDVPLTMPERASRQIASLQGVLWAILPGRIETFRFADPFHGGKASVRTAAATVSLDEVRRRGDAWQIGLHLRYDEAGDAFESHRNWALENQAYLEGPGQSRIAADSWETTDRSGSAIGMRYTFVLKEAAGLTFVYRAPGAIVSGRFPYVLRGIRLP